MLKKWLGFSLPLTQKKCKGREIEGMIKNKKKKESELEDLENSKPMHTANLEEACYKNTKDVAKQPRDEAIWIGVNYTFVQPSQVTPGLYQQTRCWWGQKETEKKEENEARLQTRIIIQDLGRMAPKVLGRRPRAAISLLPQRARLLPPVSED